jgi:hypothetical protein
MHQNSNKILRFFSISLFNLILSIDKNCQTSSLIVVNTRSIKNTLVVRWGAQKILQNSYLWDEIAQLAATVLGMTFLNYFVNGEVKSEEIREEKTEEIVYGKKFMILKLSVKQFEPQVHNKFYTSKRPLNPQNTYLLQNVEENRR